MTFKYPPNNYDKIIYCVFLVKLASQMNVLYWRYFIADHVTVL